MTYESLLSSFLGVSLVVVGFVTLFAGALSALEDPKRRLKQISIMVLLALCSLTAGFLLVTSPS
jgi:hypothetical protein